jgi:hypothetical protein
MMLDLTSDPVVREHATKCLHKQGLSVETNKFVKRIRQLLLSKPRALSCCVRFLNFPMRDVHLVYFDIRNRTRRLATLPHH